MAPVETESFFPITRSTVLIKQMFKVNAQTEIKMILLERKTTNRKSPVAHRFATDESKEKMKAKEIGVGIGNSSITNCDDAHQKRRKGKSVAIIQCQLHW